MIDLTIPNYTSINEMNVDSITLASENLYVPLNTLKLGKTIEVRGKKDFIYSNIYTRRFYSSNRLQYMFMGLTEMNTYGRLLSMITFNRHEYKYICENNRIYAVNKITGHTIILLIICIKSKYLYSLSPLVNSQMICESDSHKISCLVNKIFLDNKEFLILYRQVYKHLIGNLHPDIDIVHVNNIEKYCFNTEFIVPPKVETLMELKTEMSKISNIVAERIIK